MTLFVVIALGTVLGSLPFGPLRFGPAGALFVGLAVGALDLRLGEGLGLVQTVGLALFVYTIGLAALTSVPAAVVWVPIPWDKAPGILLVGILAQLGQYCWTRDRQCKLTHVLTVGSHFNVVPWVSLSSLFAVAVIDARVAAKHPRRTHLNLLEMSPAT